MAALTKMYVDCGSQRMLIVFVFMAQAVPTENGRGAAQTTFAGIGLGANQGTVTDTEYQVQGGGGQRPRAEAMKHTNDNMTHQRHCMVRETFGHEFIQKVIGFPWFSLHECQLSIIG